MKTTHKTRILMIEELKAPCDARGNVPDVFRAIVAKVGEDGKPRNWSNPYHEERVNGDTGGFSIRAFRCDDGKVLSLWRGREVESDDVQDYIDAVTSLRGVHKRLAVMKADEGYAADEIASMLRLIRAFRVEAVYSRPEHYHSEWLTKGEWKVETVGEFANRLRSVLSRVERSMA
jgi:hypothetical protein